MSHGDPARVARILDLLHCLVRRHPHERVGQVIMNVIGSDCARVEDIGLRLWNIDDVDLERRLSAEIQEEVTHE